MSFTYRFLAFAAFLSLTPIANAAKPLNFSVFLSGAQEVPNVVSTDTTGHAVVQIDRRHTQIRVKLSIRDAVDILGAAGAHLHCAPAGENGPVIAFLAGVLPGGLDGTLRLDLTLTEANIVNDACGATIDEVATSIRDGGVYINVHSLANAGGEIRGQI